MIVQFIVDKEGDVSDVKPLTHVGHGMEQEAVRVIKNSGRWKPAIQNGREVKAYRRQPITFQIQEG
ncbi:MAG TPA: energy transducer TonB [Niabella sp.]|nr:energy transducer TonB [Chitinophagaceae bacterium]HRN48332.1 energy transducer TonB [Niabella sp.]HRO84532.1 energy transducer TonB [Niabella sp.]